MDIQQYSREEKASFIISHKTTNSLLSYKNAMHEIKVQGKGPFHNHAASHVISPRKYIPPFLWKLNVTWLSHVVVEVARKPYFRGSSPIIEIR